MPAWCSSGRSRNTDPAQGIAIIGESSQRRKVYTVGKTITGGTKLHSVYPDRVILDRGGKLEALLLPKQFTGGGMRSRAPRLGAAPNAMLGDRMRELAAAATRPRSPTSCGRSRSSRTASSAATGSTPGRNRAAVRPAGTDARATWSPRSMARPWTTRRAAWRSCSP